MSNASFIIDRESAQRQFRLSLVMLVGMAVGAFILGVATPLPQTTQKAAITHDDAVFSGRLVSALEE
jgi:hypothetical protein